jgi:uncharacterized protein YndB with AHSA1/START domain
MNRTVHQVFEIYIATTPDKLWKAITDPEMTKQYFYDSAIESTLQPGTPLTRLRPDGSHMLDGEVIEVDPPRRLVHTFIAHESNQAEQDPPSRVTWEIEPMGGACKLTLTHEHFNGESVTAKGTLTGWNPVLSGLKTLLETGKPLDIAWPEEANA